MSVHKSPEPLDENALRALFNEVEPPASMEARWRSRVALAPDKVAPELPEVRPVNAPDRPRPRKAPWLRALGAGIAALAVGGGIVGVVAANRKSPPEPQPTIIETITNAPTASPPPVSGTSQPAAIPSGPAASQPDGGGPAGGPPAVGAGPTGGAARPSGPAAPPPAPARGPLTEWPDPANSGVPAGAALPTHSGDLHVTQAGALIADLDVNGTVYVEAPGVTLRRVRVAPPSGAYAGIRQLPSAPRLRIEDSEAGTAQYGVRQEAAGLVVQRSDIHGSASAVAVTADITIVDSYLTDVQTRGNTARLTLRHNTIGKITMLDEAGPVTDVTIENNQLGTDYYGAVVIFAPSRPGSRDIRVTGNHFRHDSADRPVPCSGWNAQAPGNSWTGNVWFGTSEPVNP